MKKFENLLLEKSNTKTIYEHIKDAVKKANIPDVIWEDDYPRDRVKISDKLTDDEQSDTLTPLVKVLRVIADTIEKYGTSDDDIEVDFYNLPGEEEWGIAIGDGR